MSRDDLCDDLARQARQMQKDGTFKVERVLESSQASHIQVSGGRQVINMCANNYLGLASHPEIISSAQTSLEEWGYGLASVRFICGTQQIHKQLEERISAFVGFEDTILYNSCWDANGGLFETILGPDDAIISDALNHASIIDGIRLCKAKRFRYRNNDMDDLRAQLEKAKHARYRLIATDGVFSMDGFLADLPSICELADAYDALIMVDDSHAVGFIGPTGRGTPEHFGVTDRIDILTGTLGKALGGGSGGYTSGRKDLVGWLRQRSRTYLFSNTVAPPVVAGALRSLELLEQSTHLRDHLLEKTHFFRREMDHRGFKILPGEHPIVPVMLGDAAVATNMANAMLEEGVYVVGFSYPVVPEGKARIRTQVSAAHSQEDLEHVIKAFENVRDRVNH
ncbi:MAG: glycine C-acetyltransferase [Pirellulales bacterium]